VNGDGFADAGNATADPRGLASELACHFVMPRFSIPGADAFCFRHPAAAPALAEAFS